MRCAGVTWAVLVLAVAASPASAAPMWLGANDVSTTSQPVGAAGVAVDPAGDAVAGWLALTGPPATLEVASRPAGGSWSTPAPLGPAANSPGPVQVAMDGAGDAFAAWARPTTTGASVVVAERPAGAAAWLTPVTLSASGENAGAPSLAVNAAGDAVVAWVQSGTSLVRATDHPVGASAWSAPVSLTGPSDLPAQDVDVALDAQGNAQAVWVAVDAADSSEGIDGATLSSAEGKWSAPVSIGSGATVASAPRLTYDGTADAIVAYTLGGIVWTAERPAGTATWSMPDQLSNGEVDAPAVQLATDDDGDALVAWAGAVGVQSSFRAAGGDAWTLSTLASEGSDPQITLDARGDAVAAWLCCDTLSYVRTAERPAASGTWQDSPVQSEAGQLVESLGLASDADGDSLAIWSASMGSGPTASGVVQADPYIGSGPELDGLAIPAVGLVGEPLTFSVSPFDVWTTLGPTFWLFGDGAGSGLLGTSVTHTYAAPGVYPVTVTGIDAAGNESTATGNVAIDPAPPPPAPPPAAQGATGTTGMIGVSSSTPTLVAATAVAPELSDVSVSRSRFRVGPTATAVSAGATSGTSFQFTLSAAARLHIAITHTEAGALAGTRCVARTRSTPAAAKRCPLTITDGTLVRAHEAPGRDHVSFTGRIGSHALAAGPYLASLGASDAAGHSRTVSVGLRVLR